MDHQGPAAASPAPGGGGQAARVEAYLWPQLLTDPRTETASAAELLHLYPTRGAVPHDTWTQLFDSAREAIDVLFFAGTHMFEQHDLVG